MSKNKGRVTLYLMRHGQTILNKAGRTQGWCDGVLTPEGVKVAEDVGRGLSDTKFKAVYSSDLGRAIKTATIVINKNAVSGQLQLKELEGLREVYFGKYEGELESVKNRDILEYLKVKSFEEAADKYELHKAYQNSIAALDETKEAEDYDTSLNRIIKTLENICLENASDDGVNVLVVCHGGMIRLIISYLSKQHKVMKIDNASISKIKYEDGTFKVEAVNDTSYKKTLE